MKMFFVTYGSHNGTKEYIREAIVLAKDYLEAADVLIQQDKELYHSSVRIISIEEYDVKKSGVLTIYQSRGQ